MFKQLGMFAILAVCFFAMLISGCPNGVRDIMSPPPVAEPVVAEPVTEEPVTEEPVTPPVTPPTVGPDGMVLISAGSFEMGSDDADADADERPVHTVHLDAFYMDVYEVTNAEFKGFLDANPGLLQIIEDEYGDSGNLSHWDGTDYPVGRADHPVVNVSWHAALAYAQWARKRLPTEAEWEYAARGRLAGKKYPWGDAEPTSTYANHEDSGIGGTTSVGRYAANGYGLYDMAGNVSEWCFDEYDADFYTESANSQNPIASGVEDSQLGSERVLRGGSWRDSASYLRVANRIRSSPSDANSFTGFRCVRPVTP